jgi:hypothetical protein
MKRGATAFEDGFRAAGIQTDELRLRMLEFSALDRAHNNIKRAVPFLKQSLLGDMDAFEALCFERLSAAANIRATQRQREEPKAPVSRADDARHGPKKTGRVHPKGPTKGQIGAGPVVGLIAKSVYDKLKTNDGRTWGDVKAHELESMARDGKVARRFLRNLPVLAGNARFKPLREIFTENEFGNIIG